MRDLVGPDIPVIDVVQPVVDWAALHHPHGELALDRNARHGSEWRVRTTPLRPRIVGDVSGDPLLASAIEEGFHNGTISSAVVEAYFADGWAADKDALLLGTLPFGDG